MKKNFGLKLFLYFILPLCVLPSLYAQQQSQDVNQQKQYMSPMAQKLSSEIRLQLQNLKTQSTTLQTQLTTETKRSEELYKQVIQLQSQSANLNLQLAEVKKDWMKSLKQVTQLQTQLKDLNTCLTATNQKLTEYSVKLSKSEDKIIQQKQQLSKRFFIILILSIFIVINILARVLKIVLKLKYNITLPFWLNILL